VLGSPLLIRHIGQDPLKATEQQERERKGKLRSVDVLCVIPVSEFEGGRNGKIDIRVLCLN